MSVLLQTSGLNCTVESGGQLAASQGRFQIGSVVLLDKDRKSEGGGGSEARSRRERVRGFDDVMLGMSRELHI